MKSVMVVAIIILAGALTIGYQFSRFGVESPEYQVIRADGEFEIREYDAMVVVSTPMDNSDPSEGGSFMRLFRYISGENTAEQKIAMTTPVLTTEEGGASKMNFIVPMEVAREGVPDAGSRMLEIESMGAGRFAVYRFSGAWNQERVDSAKRKLAEWMHREQLTPEAAPMLAGYDPPFTPDFMKRNEILVRISSAGDGDES